MPRLSDFSASGNILISGDINDRTLERFIKQFYIHRDLPSVSVFINSNGGELDIAYAIIDLMKSNGKQKVNTVVTAKACSCAADILLHGDVRYAFPHAVIMFHDGSLETSGNTKTILSVSQFYNQKEEKLNAKIAELMDVEIAEIEAKMKNDWYMTAQEAKKNNIIHKILSSRNKFSNLVSHVDNGESV